MVFFQFSTSNIKVFYIEDENRIHTITLLHQNLIKTSQTKALYLQLKDTIGILYTISIF